MKPFTTTAECVSSGHPDKVADQISDAIVDLYLKADSSSHVACETLCSTDKVILNGEVESKATFSPEIIENTVREVVRRIGYHSNRVEGFDADTLEVSIGLVQQSPEISQGVQVGGAGDQGVMFGTATSETESGLPLAQKIASDLMRFYDSWRVENPALKPDAKSQVVVHAVDGSLVIKHITLAMSHQANVTKTQLLGFAQYLVDSVLDMNDILTSDYSLTVNGTGSFVHSGPSADTGLTGRKIVVDQVAGALVGGGAFSGKDPSKVDRSAAYFARYLAKHLVAAGVAPTVTIGIAYTIGKVQPDSVSVDTHGYRTQFTGEEMSKMLQSLISFAPNNIIHKLKLTETQYALNCNYSHYSDSTAPWEVLDPDFVSSLKKCLK